MFYNNMKRLPSNILMGEMVTNKLHTYIKLQALLVSLLMFLATTAAFAFNSYSLTTLPTEPDNQ